MQSARDSSSSGASAGFALQQLAESVAPRVGVIASLVVLTYLVWPFGLLMIPVVIFTQLEAGRATFRVLSGTRMFGQFDYSLYQRDLAITPDAAKEVRVFKLAGWLRVRYDTGVRRAIRGSDGRQGIGPERVLTDDRVSRWG